MNSEIIKPRSKMAEIIRLGFSIWIWAAIIYICMQRQEIAGLRHQLAALRADVSAGHDGPSLTGDTPPAKSPSFKDKDLTIECTGDQFQLFNLVSKSKPPIVYVCDDHDNFMPVVSVSPQLP